MKRGNILKGRIAGLILVTSLILTGVISLTGCAAARPPEGKPGEEEKEAVFAVTTIKAVSGQINDYIELTGDVETQSSIDVYADNTGKLTRVLVSIGQRVTKGQVLAEVDPSRPGSNYVASPVKAPIDGTVTALPLAIGTTIVQGMAVAKINTLDQLQIKTFVAERFIARMRVGQEAIVSFMAYPDVRFAAQVTELNPVVDPATRTMDVKLKLATPDTRIKAGMFGRIKIITTQKTASVKIPVDCIISRFGENYVFVLADKQAEEAVYRVERRQVTPGIRIDNMVEVTAGLNADEEVVSEGQTLLDDKSLVKVVREQTPLPLNHEVE